MTQKAVPYENLAYYYHPAFNFSSKNILSLKNLKTLVQCANSAVGFLAALYFSERNGFDFFPENSFGLDENLLPQIDISQCDYELKSCRSDIPKLLATIFFKDKDVSRGKIPKNLNETSVWIRSLQKRREISAKEALIEIIESLSADGVSISLPPLWSAGVVWKPTEELFSQKNQMFSADGEALFEIIKKWAEIHSFNFLVASGELPYPYASLEPLLVKLLGDKNCASTFLKEYVGKGNEAIAEKLTALIENKNEKVIIWAKDIDKESQKIIEKILNNISSPLIVFSDKSANRPIKIEEINFLFLLDEGEEWIKDNCSLFGLGNNIELLKYIEKKEALKFSPFESLFPEDLKRIENQKFFKLETATPASIFNKSFNAKDDSEKEKIVIRSLIESGQIKVALERIEKIKNIDDEINYFKLWAKSQNKDFSYVLKEKDRIKNLNEDDHFLLSLFASEALWLSGKIEQAAKELENLYKKSKNDNQKFRVLSQMFLLNFNCGETRKAEEILNEMKEFSEDGGIKEKILINHHYGALEKSKNNEEKALNFFVESANWAKKGGYHLHETLLNIEIGNCLRLIGKFDESINYLKKAVFQSKILRNKEGETQARFDIIISEVEKGSLLRAQEEIVALTENRRGKAPLTECAVEHYWLSRILFLRGELIQALEEVEKPLRSEKRFLDKELNLSLNILRGNILYQMNEFKSLQLLLKKLSEEDIFSLGADFILEYYSLLLLAQSKKIVKISEKEKAIAEESFSRGSPLSKITYLLSKAESGSEDSFAAAQEAYQMGQRFNSILAKAQSLLLLYKMNKLPQIGDEEISEIEKFIKENKIKGELCELLKICEKKEKKLEEKEENLISFLYRSPSLNLNEAISTFLKFSQVGGVVVVAKNGSAFTAGIIPSKEEILSLLGEEVERKIGKFFVFSTLSKEGIWGAIVCQNKIEKSQKELFSIFIKLQNSEENPLDEDKEEKEDFGFIDKIIIGKAPSILEVKRKIIDAAQFNFPVLITGEAGSGKEACAKSIHLSSARARKEWVAFNCANLTPTLAASQLFGHKKGSFTGADSDKEGLVSAAKESTLFLDEIGELPLETQANFLRFLQDGSYQPIGSNVTLNSNARIIAATNRNLEEEVKKGRFREDLYYRLKVITINVPPLRERKEDIIPLFEKFLEEECEREKIKKPIVKKGVYLKLISYQWLGNVRELQNFAKRAIVSSIKSGIIDEKQISFEKGFSNVNLTLNQKLEEYEKEIIEEILKRNSFNISESAKEAGISRQSFHQKAKKFGLIR